MIVENSPSARMQVRSRGELVAPASCCVCGNSTCDLGYIDIGVFIDFHGTVYLCMYCITQAGETVGMYTPDEVKHFQSQIESLVAAKEHLTTELANATEHNRHLEYLVHSKFTASAGTYGSIGAGVPSAHGDDPLPFSGADGGEPEPEESVKIRKPRGTSASKLHDIAFE